MELNRVEIIIRRSKIKLIIGILAVSVMIWILIPNNLIIKICAIFIVVTYIYFHDAKPLIKNGEGVFYKPLLRKSIKILFINIKKVTIINVTSNREVNYALRIEYFENSILKKAGFTLDFPDDCYKIYNILKSKGIKCDLDGLPYP